MSIVDSIRIAENFTLAEVLRSHQYPELQISPDDLAGQTVVNFMRLAHEFLQPARDRFGHPFVVTSWLRSLALDLAVGGRSKLKRHTTGLGADFYVHDIPPSILLRSIARYPEGLTWDRLCIYPAERRFHVDTRPWEEGPPRKLLYKDWIKISYEEAILLSTPGRTPVGERPAPS